MSFIQKISNMDDKIFKNKTDLISCMIADKDK